MVCVDGVRVADQSDSQWSVLVRCYRQGYASAQARIVASKAANRAEIVMKLRYVLTRASSLVWSVSG